MKWSTLDKIILEIVEYGFKTHNAVFLKEILKMRNHLNLSLKIIIEEKINDNIIYLQLFVKYDI